MSVSVIICAAGKGTRTGFSENKVFAPYEGIPVIERTIAAFMLPAITQIILAYNAEDEEKAQALAKKYPIELIVGGDTRTQTVYNALQAVTGEIVLIHDGARPFVSKQEIIDCIECVRAHESAICAVPVVNTQARCVGGEIVAVPDRRECYDVLTPQGFVTKRIVSAYAQAIHSDKAYTDDGSVYAEFCGNPHIYEGNRANRKLTYAEDFQPHPHRVGFGVDTHAFGKAQDYITLCGVQVPSESGLIAHSDGDVAVHALMDALLSAAGKKDIGHYFPDTDEKWRGADSMEMLAEVLRILQADGLYPASVSIAIQAEKPRLAKYITQMQERISSALTLPCDRVGISAGTNEKLGYVGEGKGITVYAYVLLTQVKFTL
jgi:2-C-methyl-D-erythritol 4-phosphate cytidylyltransferase/2-C-methyl-D-erythritol 2,4-cyclodiphosphate synthase